MVNPKDLYALNRRVVVAHHIASRNTEATIWETREELPEEEGKVKLATIDVDWSCHRFDLDTGSIVETIAEGEDLGKGTGRAESGAGESPQPLQGEAGEQGGNEAGGELDHVLKPGVAQRVVCIEDTVLDLRPCEHAWALLHLSELSAREAGPSERDRLSLLRESRTEASKVDAGGQEVFLTPVSTKRLSKEKKKKREKKEKKERKEGPREAQDAAAGPSPSAEATVTPLPLDSVQRGDEVFGEGASAPRRRSAEGVVERDYYTACRLSREEEQGYRGGSRVDTRRGGSTGEGSKKRSSKRDSKGGRLISSGVGTGRRESSEKGPSSQHSQGGGGGGGGGKDEPPASLWKFSKPAPPEPAAGAVEGKPLEKKSKKKGRGKGRKESSPGSPVSPASRPTSTAHLRWAELSQDEAKRIVAAFGARLLLVEVEPKELLEQDLTGLVHWMAPTKFSVKYVAYKISEDEVELIMELLVLLAALEDKLEEYVIHRSVWDTV